MPNPIDELIQRFGDNELAITRLKIVSLERWLYKSYEPNKFADGDFEQRLIKWIGNVSSDDDKQVLLRLLVELFYLGPVEFEELYRCAYQGPVARWLIDIEGIDICAADAQKKLVAAARDTWFCPVTDSFRVNAFFHINNLAAGGSLRPDWRSLHALGEVGKIQRYCASQKVKRLVLLEDFVGGGSQSLSAVEFAAMSLPNIAVLFVPLVICPDGASNARDMCNAVNARTPNKLRFEPVMALPSNAFLTRTVAPAHLDGPLLRRLREIIDSTYPQVCGGAISGKPYDAYGFPPIKPTGGLVVMYSNTPDNTLPLVHWRPQSNSWEPVFPRHSRD